MPKDYQKEIGIINKQKLIIAEGADAKRFLIRLLNKKEINDIQVIDFGGIDELGLCLESIKTIEGYEDIASFIVFRDSETSTQSAIQKINSCFRKAGLSTSDLKPFVISKQNGRNIGFGLFPGFDENNVLYDSGTLEHLCVLLFKEKSNHAVIKSYIDDFQTKNGKFKKIHKNEFHALVSFTDDFVGFKIGETALKGGFDFNSSYLLPYLKLIAEM